MIYILHRKDSGWVLFLAISNNFMGSPEIFNVLHMLFWLEVRESRKPYHSKTLLLSFEVHIHAYR